ncbi:MAG: glycoside hydrolase family 15 protein [Acidobacteriaceae bacterium]|nr:glycoside hydrolase family 15 protein [Acidobacteriaceae bacterium]
MFGLGKKHEAAKQVFASRIEDYALIGDLHTAALVSRNGSIDWLCWPHFASPACFASLLGTEDNGYWRLAPASDQAVSTRRYRDTTLILETTFTTPEGEVCVTDFMPPRGEFSHLIRIVKGVRGTVKMHMDLKLRFDYGLTVPWVTQYDRKLRAVAGPNMIVLRTSCSSGVTAELEGKDLATVSDFTLHEGQEVSFCMTYAPSNAEDPGKTNAQDELEDTIAYWTRWAQQNTYQGPYKDVVARSLATLKALTYKPTGGMVAAVTTSLPEQIGGERNWDYRFCWLRDTAFTLLALILAGYTEEATNWRLWLLRAIAGSPDQIQALYGINGERNLIEWEASWLSGYEGSRPVRIGNAAIEQFQLDVYGEVAIALNHIPDALDDLRTPATALQANIVDRVCDVWQQPDEGIWEVRGGRKHFVYSKAMAWVALDRAVKHYERYDGKGDVKRWRKNRDLLHKQICSKGFNKKLNSFTLSYGSDTIDAACLQMLHIGFLPPDDPRMIGTVEAVEKYLLRDGLVQRYDTSKFKDGLSGSEGTFLACSFWLASALHIIGRRDDARQLYERLLSLRNDVGLLSEEYDTKAKRMLGNFPQALSHIALVHTAFTLNDQWKPGPFVELN